MPKYNKNCIVCNSPFMPKNKPQVYCSLKCFHLVREKSHPNTPANFWKRVKVGGPTECWPWTGPLNQDGYGRVSWHGKLIMAHRLAFILTHGPLEKEYSACHNCPDGDLPACCNPGHLWKGTHAENMVDKKNKNRVVIRKGEGNQNCKYSDEQVIHLRTLYATGKYTMCGLALAFGFSRSHAKRIIHGISRA